MEDGEAGRDGVPVSLVGRQATLTRASWKSLRESEVSLVRQATPEAGAGHGFLNGRKRTPGKRTPRSASETIADAFSGGNEGHLEVEVDLRFDGFG